MVLEAYNKVNHYGSVAERLDRCGSGHFPSALDLASFVCIAFIRNLANGWRAGATVKTAKRAIPSTEYKRQLFRDPLVWDWSQGPQEADNVCWSQQGSLTLSWQNAARW